MDAVRSKADAVEKIVAKEVWPFPGYEELLFKL
jgi:glutamine synthetase